ncbi:E3 ubiquitin-protein ligase Mdm2 [Portunus trituberculatus]|uniref:E3 ubiquitin-protein ligase Mdm2 n=1 Tax=Portunus trituberculatus TaxID=210409 RepID=A0A5B7CQL4_PORTR|nr:E3 ubiquitin-protein ligase Mdm2 [Portunus trituberculatus]
MPPDLTPETRPLAENPTRSCEDDTRSPPPPPGTADHSSSSNGGGLQLAQESPASTASLPNTRRVGQVCYETRTEAGEGTEGAAPSASSVVNTYYLSPQLKAAFVSVGATDRAYSFKENIIKVHPARVLPCPEVPTPVPDNLSSSVHAGGSNDSTCRSSVPVGATPSTSGNGIVVSQGVSNLENVATPGSEAGVPRICGRQRALPGPSNTPVDITCPDIPDSCSDAESVYSVQDYETEYCRNTEFESSEEEDLMEVNSEIFEEYEPPSDDARDDKDQCDDSDSSIDDVEIAVLAYTLVQDEAEEGFWADDDSVTDSEHSDEDNDPECVSDRWDCLTCGLKNKPFVRYCSKCWQLRKNWLPDPPKKRRRKPRPKKKNTRNRMASGPSEQSTSQGASQWKDEDAGTSSESSVGGSSQAEREGNYLDEGTSMTSPLPWSSSSSSPHDPNLLPRRHPLRTSIYVPAAAGRVGALLARARRALSERRQRSVSQGPQRALSSSSHEISLDEPPSDGTLVYSRAGRSGGVAAAWVTPSPCPDAPSGPSVRRRGSLDSLGYPASAASTSLG